MARLPVDKSPLGFDGFAAPPVLAGVVDELRRAKLRNELFGDPIPPTMLGRYEVLSVLGHGGMGSVVAAYDPQLERRVAIKFVGSPTESRAPELQAALVEEARALARLSHPNVVAIHDIGVAGGQAFVAMEEVAGVSLTDWIARLQAGAKWRRGGCVEEIVRMFVAAGHGLVAAHAAGLVHRDFKPSNVVVGDDGRARVLDFGVACLDGAHDSGVAGTPAYMAPEQRLGGAVDARADVWAFCVSLYEALDGQRPPSGVALRPTVRVPRWVCRALEPGLVVDRERRSATLGTVLQALTRRRRRGSVLAIAAISAVAGVGLGTLVLNTREPPCEPDGTPLGDVWNDAARSRVAQAMTESGFDAASGEPDATLRRLDDYVERWEDIRHSACLAARQRHEISENDFDRRLACLHEQRVRLEGLVAAIGELETPGGARHAANAIDALDSVERCASPTNPPVKLATLSAADARIFARASAMRDLGDAAAAGRILDGLSDGDAMPAEVTMERVAIAWRLGEIDEGEDLLATALVQARRENDLEGEFMVWLSFVVLAGDRQDGTLTTFESVARALVQGGGVSTLSQMKFALSLGNATLNRHPADAARVLEEGVTLGSAFVSERPLHRPTEATLAALTISRGVAAFNLGDNEGAEAWQTRAYEILVDLRGERHPDVSRPLINLAAIATRRGEPMRALALMDQARSILTPFAESAPVELASVQQNRAAALFDLGRFDEAGAAFAATLELLERTYGPEYPPLAYPLTGLGAVALEHGDVAGALALLERSAALQERLDDPNELANLKFALARARDATIPRSGLDLAREALALLEANPSSPIDRQRMSAWVAERDPGESG